MYMYVYYLKVMWHTITMTTYRGSGQESGLGSRAPILTCERMERLLLTSEYGISAHVSISHTVTAYDH